MRRLSNGIITFASLLTIIVLVYRRHTKEIPLETHSNSRKVGRARSFKDRPNSKDITHEPPGGISQDSSDVAQLIDPPAGKTTRWNIPTSIRLCLVAIIVIMAVVVVVIGRYCTSFSQQQAFLQHLHAHQRRTMPPFLLGTTSATSTMQIPSPTLNPCLVNMDSWARWLTFSRLANAIYFLPLFNTIFFRESRMVSS